MRFFTPAFAAALLAFTGISAAQSTTTATIAKGAFEIRGLKGLFWDGIANYNEAVEWMPAHGMNWLMLCYTAYPESARDWRKDYTPEHLTEMRNLTTRARDLGVTVCLSFNPGIWSNPPLNHSSDADYQAAWRKVKAAHDVGITWIALCLDDINRGLTADDKAKYKTLEAAQVDFVNRLWRDMEQLDPRFHLIFCPSAYTTADMRAHMDYTLAIGRGIDPKVDIFWTGPSVVSKSITAADAKQVEEWLQRKPFIWDNYPVNDMFGAGPRPWQPILAPLEGRAGDLPAAVSGILFNPMKQWESSQIPLVSVGNYLRDPAGYDPDKQRAAILADFKPPTRRAIELLLATYGSTFVGEPGYPPAPALATAEERTSAAATLGEIKSILTGSHDKFDKQLWEDIKPTVEADLKAAQAAQ